MKAHWQWLIRWTYSVISTLLQWSWRKSAQTIDSSRLKQHGHCRGSGTSGDDVTINNSGHQINAGLWTTAQHKPIVEKSHLCTLTGINVRWETRYGRWISHRSTRSPSLANDDKSSRPQHASKSPFITVKGQGLVHNWVPIKLNNRWYCRLRRTAVDNGRI